jgi:uncharacterized protein (DUF4415 family)
MGKREDIVSYTAEEIAAKRARGESKTDWAAVTAKTEEDLAADTASDPAWDGIPEDWYKNARVVNAALTRPKQNKQQITMRFDADVLEYFRSQGRGWQGRMNAVLRSFITGR